MTGPTNAASLLAWARTQTWALEPGHLEALTGALVALSRGQSDEIVAARHGRPARRAEERTEDAIAVLPIAGPITYHPGLFSELFGGTTIKALSRDLQFAMDEPRVKSIFMPISSGGGTVTGVPEFAATLRIAREKKPIVACVDAFCASAAYWIASSASEVVSVPSGETGGLGVFAVHLDFSEQLKQIGVKPTIVGSTPEKVEGSELEPLSADARADMQANVDRINRQFISAVARGRGIGIETVREKFGRGRVFDAARARAVGMVDRIATFDQALAGASLTRPRRAATATVTARPSLSSVLGEAIHNPRHRRLALLKHS